MRKLFWLICLCILCALTAPGGSVSAAESSSVSATIDSDQLVTISGMISAGPGQMVTILVTDPSGNVDYINGAVTAGLGNFQVAYTMPSVTPGTYQVTVNTLTEARPLKTTFAYGVNNELKSLSLSKGGLNKAFAANETEYAVNVDSRVDSLTVTPTVSDSTATVKVNGTAVTSGQPSAAISLADGINSITVTVTSLAGEAKTYTIVVTKAGAIVTDLQAAVAFDSSKQVTVSGTIDAGAGQMVTVLITDPKGDTEYVGAVISGAGGAFEASYPLTNVVNGRYTVRVGALGVDTAVTTHFDYVELTNLVVSNVTISPAFDKDTLLYTAAAGDAVESVTVTPTCGDSAATVTVNGVAVTSGAASGSLTLDRESNVINVIVTGRDGEASTTYVVAITKTTRELVDGSAEATIDKHKLVTINGTVGAKEDYPVSVLITDPMGEAEHLDATETTADGAYEFAYTTPNKTVGAYAVSVGAVALREPVSTFFRIDAGNPDLSDLALGDDATWIQAFAADRTEYDAIVPFATASIAVTPTAIDPLAIIKVNEVEVESGAVSDSMELNVGRNAIQVLVTTMDGQEKAYTVNVRKCSNDAGLSDLGVDSGSLSPSFAAGKTSYDVTVSNSTAMLNVTPTVNESTATVKVNGGTVASGAAYGPILLNVGANTIEVEVTAGDTITKQTYILTVTREKSKDASLSGLVLSQGSLNPSFAVATTEYAMTVTNPVSAMTVTPTVSEDTATVKVNGSAVTSGSASNPVSLNVGINTITVEVTAGDGTTKKTYVITVTREKSKDATLSGLSLTGGGTLTPSFLASKTSYAKTVAHTVTSLTVMPTANEGTATVKVNGTTVISGRASGAISLHVGENEIEVEVTAGDATTQRTYTVTVSREPSCDATLRGMSVSGGTLTPTFAPDTTSYTATVSSDVHQVTVTPIVNEDTARVWVNGAAVQSGKASVPIILSLGPNTVKIEVTAGDKVTKRTYTINVIRELPGNVNLRDLNVSNGSLSPIFALGRTSYSVSVGNDVTELTVSATAYDSKATVRINSGSAASGSASRSISLDEGANTIQIEVTAQNGAKQVYTITVNRDRSSNAYLSNLTISSGSLTPAFSATVPGYAVSVGNDITSVTVTPTAADSDATVTVNGSQASSGSPSRSIPLSPGANTITIVVAAANGGTRHYTIVVTRARSGENNLSSLTISSGALTPTFAAGTQSYAASVENEVETLDVAATALHPHATVELTTGVSPEKPNGDLLDHPISLNVGLNLIRIVVTAENGSSRIYVLQVTRAKSTNADLSDLALSEGSLGTFDRDRQAYSVEVANNITSLTVTPTVAHEKATVEITDGSGNVLADPINLQLGANLIKVVVTAEDMAAKKTYTITVNRTRLPFAVTFVLNDGSGDQTVQTVYEGTTMGSTLPAPTDEHYTFGGWNTQGDGEGTDFCGNTEVYHDYTVYAQWTPKDYPVTFKANGVTHDSKVFSYGASVGSWRPDPPTRQHYLFSGWNTQNDGNGDDLENTTKVIGDTTFFAQWTPAPYTVSFDQNRIGATPPDPTSKVFSYGASVGNWRPDPPTSEHFAFSGWNKTADGSGAALTDQTEVTEDITFYAQWVRKNYTVEFDQDGGESPNYPVHRTVPYEGTVSGVFWPIAPTRNHYEFAGWYTQRNGGGSEFAADETKVCGDITVFAKWTPVNYTVTLNVDGGDPIVPPASATRTVPYATAVGPLPTPTRTHYNFGGWYTGHNGTGTELKTTTPVAGNIEVFAKWIPVNYTVIFNANGGSLVGPSSRTVAYYHEVGALPQATLAHHTFAGWYPNSDGGGNEFTAATRIIGDIQVFAKWTPVNYTVTFDKNGGEVDADPTSAVVPYGTEWGTWRPTPPLRAHYTYSGWNSATDGSGAALTDATQVTGSMTFYAQWTAKTYTMSFDLNYDDAGDEPDSQSVVYPANWGALPKPTRTGYEFAGWNTDPAGNGTGYADNAPLTGNITVYAQWIRGYQVAVGELEGGEVIAAPSSAKAGAVVTLTVQSSSGWRLKAGTLRCFSGADSIEISHVAGETYSFTMPAADVLVSALFEQLYVVTFDLNGGTGGSMTVTVVSGDAVGSDFPSEPTRTNYQFRGWSTSQHALEGSWFEADTEVTGDITVYAQWGSVWDVAIEVTNPDGGALGADPSTDVSAGTAITVSVVPEPGYRLKSLRYSHGSTDEPITQADGCYRFTMPSADVLVTAEFERYYTVSFMNAGVEYARREAASGKAVDSWPDAPMREGYRFMGWKTAVGGADFSASTSVNGDITVNADWSELFAVSIAVVSDPPGGSVSANKTVAVADEPVTLIVSPQAGMRLKAGTLRYSDGVTSQAINETTLTWVMPAADVTVTAEFELIPPDTYSVSIPMLTGGSISASATTVEQGTNISLTVTPDDGWRLKPNSLKYKIGTDEYPITDFSFIMPNADVAVIAQFEQLSSNANLSSLAIAGVTLSPGFAADLNTYSVRVPVNATSVSVTATAADDTATLQVNGASVDSGEAIVVDLSGEGDTDVAIQVTAEDGTTRTYSLTVARYSSDASLRDAKVYADGQLQEFSNEVDEHGQPTFHPDWPAHSIGYYLAAGQASVSFTVDVTPNEGHAIVSAVIPGIDELPDVPVPSVGGSFVLSDLEVGGYDVEFAITAEDGTTWVFNIWFGVYSE